MEFPDFGFEIIPRTELPQDWADCANRDLPLSLVNAEAMDADQVVRLCTWVVAASSEFGGRHGDSNPYSELYGEIFSEVSWLPSRDLRKARKVYGALATSELPSVRASIAPTIKQLSFTDPRYACMLWDRLFRDPNEAVRTEAYRESIPPATRFRDDLGLPTKSELNLFGLTTETFQKLDEVYAYAQQGVNLCDPSEPLPDVPLLGDGLM